MGPIADNPAANRIIGGDKVLIVVEFEIACAVSAVDLGL